jgi:two-component system, chemotaxis family, protein-glutamate methylesterase/glutaminase
VSPERGRYRLVVVGCSWGGLEALSVLLADLPADFRLPVVVVQHRTRHPSSVLLHLLAAKSALPVVEADDKEELAGGRVYLAPADYHLLVEDGSLALSVDELVRFSRPSVDVLFESAADAYGAGVIGVVLTGANDDGAAGLLRIHRHGGFGIVQDPETAERPEMPAAAIAAGGADRVAPLEEIGRLLAELARTPAPTRGRAAT